jgi:DNA-binding MarR family transcriptional regulator
LQDEDLVTRLDRSLLTIITKMAPRRNVFGVGPAAMMVMRRLAFSGVSTLTELADWMGVSRPTVTEVTNKLAAQGLIERRREEDDRRVVRIRATEDGTRLIGRLEQARREHMGRILSRLSAQDVEFLADIAERLAASIDAASVEDSLVV